MSGKSFGVSFRVGHSLESRDEEMGAGGMSDKGDRSVLIQGQSLISISGHRSIL